MGGHTCNSLFSTKIDANYKDKVFPDGECLHTTIKDAVECITCLPIKPKNMIRIKCALGFCDECPEYNIPSEELDDGPNASIIHFSVYTYQGRCSIHGTIPNVPIVCILCEENYDIKNSPIKRPTYGKKKNLSKMSFYIGEFHKVHDQPMLNKYAYRSILLCLLGNRE